MDDYSKILDYLLDQQAQRPELAEVIDLHLALLSAQSQANVSAAADPSAGSLRLRSGQAGQAMDTETARASLEQGRPLLAQDAASMDWDEFEQLFDQISQLSAQHRPDLAGAFEDIRMLADGNPAWVRTLATDYLAEGHAHEAESLDLNGELLDFVLNNALHPFLRAQAAALTLWLDDDMWRRGYCPACGGEPDLAVFEKKTGARRLLCSRCDTEWTFKRVACPFCSNEDPRRLAHYPGEDGGYRLDVCEACGRYLKTVDRREAWREVSLPAERVLTVGMDLAAADEGYHGR